MEFIKSFFKIILSLISILICLFLSVVVYSVGKHFINSTTQKHTALPFSVTAPINKSPSEISELLHDKEIEGYCHTNTAYLKEKASNINMTFYYPCGWMEDTSNYEAKSVICAYTHQLSDTVVAGFQFEITGLPFEVTDFFSKKIRTKEFAINFAHHYGNYLSSKEVTINNVKGEDIFIKKDTSSGVVYYLIYYFLYKSKIITLEYYVGAPNEKKAADMYFDNYREMFDKWAKKTEFL